MSKFKIDQLITTFSAFGKQLTNPDEALINIIESEHHYNAWFTSKSVKQAVTAIGEALNERDLTTWLKQIS